jgi:hypothetical protein
MTAQAACAADRHDECDLMDFIGQLQTSAPDKQPDHQPRHGTRGPADIDVDRLGARTVRPSGG